MRTITKRFTIAAATLVLAVGVGAGTAVGDSSRDAPVTPATEWHGTPGNTPGFTDEQRGACPAGAGDGCDGGLHGIANNPGQSGDSPAEQGNPSCQMHAGFNGAKRQCP